MRHTLTPPVTRNNNIYATHEAYLKETVSNTFCIITMLETLPKSYYVWLGCVEGLFQAE